MNKTHICKICGSNNTRLVDKKERFKYKGFVITIPHYKSVQCDTCGEAIVEEESYKKSIQLLKNFHTRIDKIIK